MTWNRYDSMNKMTVWLHPLPIRCPFSHCDFKRYALPGDGKEELEFLQAQHQLCILMRQKMAFTKIDHKGYEVWINKDWDIIVVKVESSTKGEFYDVTMSGNEIHCECKGFQFRESCKHSIMVKTLF